MAQVYKGYNGAGNQAARIAGLSPEMDAAAAKVLADVRTLAAGHNVTGEYVSNLGVDRIKGKRGVTDRIVYGDHEAAASIEFGHRTRGGKGYVEGLHIFGRAAGVH